TVGPLFQRVLTTGEPTWDEHQRLLLDRNGFLEECFFTYSYSPLFDGAGSIGGVLDTVTETTEQIVNARRLASVIDLQTVLVETTSVTDVCIGAVAALAPHQDDVPHIDLHLQAGDELPLIASSRRILGRVLLRPSDVDELRGALRDHRSVVLSTSRFATSYAVPIAEREGIAGIIRFELNPTRPFDDQYRSYLQLLADTVATSLESAVVRARELGEARRISETLQSAMLAPAANFATVAARYEPAEGAVGRQGLVRHPIGRWPPGAGDRRRRRPQPGPRRRRWASCAAPARR
ncbi:MAG: hypothetical protein R2705_25410, partial [Ilumatobacteraceae bacterium]